MEPDHETRVPAPEAATATAGVTKTRAPSAPAAGDVPEAAAAVTDGAAAGVAGEDWEPREPRSSSDPE